MIVIFKKSLNVGSKSPLRVYLMTYEGGVRGLPHFQHANLMYFEQENN